MGLKNVFSEVGIRGRKTVQRFVEHNDKIVYFLEKWHKKYLADD